MIILANSYNENDTSNVRDYSDSLQDSKTEANLSAVADTFGYYMDFNGTNAHYTIDGALSFASAFTIHFEFYTDDATTKRFIHSREDHSYIFIESGQLTFGIHDEATAKNVQTGASTVTAGSWFWGTAIYNGSTITVYLNGVKVTTFASHTLTDTNDVFVGSEFDSTSWYDGRLRDYRIYDNALSENEVNALRSTSQGIFIGMEGHSLNLGDLITSKVGESRQSAVVFATETNSVRVLPDANSPLYFKGQKWLRFGHRWDTARQHYFTITGEITNPSVLFTDGNTKFSETDDTNRVAVVDKDGLREFGNTTFLTANTTIVAQDRWVMCNATGGAFTVTLPASPFDWEIHTIKDANGDANAGGKLITISGNGNNIDGSATALINNGYMALSLVYNGTEWSLV